jgi:hypothetical protein
VASKRKKKDEHDNDNTDNESNNTDASGELGGVAQGRKQGGKVASLQGKGGKRGGKGKKRYVINTRCLLPTGISTADS